MKVLIACEESQRVCVWNDPVVSVLRSRTYWGIAKAMSEQWR